MCRLVLKSSSIIGIENLVKHVNDCKQYTITVILWQKDRMKFAKMFVSSRCLPRVCCPPAGGAHNVMLTLIKPANYFQVFHENKQNNSAVPPCGCAIGDIPHSLSVLHEAAKVQSHLLS